MRRAGREKEGKHRGKAERGGLDQELGAHEVDHAPVLLQIVLPEEQNDQLSTGGGRRGTAAGVKGGNHGAKQAGRQE